MAGDSPSGSAPEVLTLDGEGLARHVRDGRLRVHRPNTRVAGAALSELVRRESRERRPIRLLSLEGVVVAGDLELELLGASVALRDCRVRGSLLLDGSNLKDLVLTGGTRIHQDLSLRHARVHGDLDLTGLATRGVDLGYAVVDGATHLDRLHPPPSRPRSGEAPLVAVNADGARLRSEPTLVGARVGDDDTEALVSAVTEDQSTESGATWDRTLEVLALGAGLAAWVAVVGGARVWGQLYAAGVPAVPTIVGIGREWMIVEGLRVLTVPLLIATVVALGYYYTPLPERDPRRPRAEEVAGSPGLRQARRLQRFAARPEQLSLLLVGFLLLALASSVPVWGPVLDETPSAGWWVGGVTLASAALAAGVCYRRRTGLITGSLVVVAVASLAFILIFAWFAVLVVFFMAMAALTVFTLWVTLGALEGKDRAGVAVTLFVAVMAWSGSMVILQEAGAKAAPQAWARITFNDGSTVDGLLLGRTGERVYVAWPLSEGDGRAPRRVTAFENSEIATTAYADDALSTYDRDPLPQLPGTLPPYLLPREEGPGASPPLAPPDTPDPSAGPSPTEGTSGNETEPGPSTSPGPRPQPPIRTSAWSLNQQDITFSVHSLVRQAGFVELELSVRNDSGSAWTVGDALSRDGSDAADGLRLMDAEGSYVYDVATGGDRCVCTTGLADAVLQEGESMQVTALFAAPPGGTVDLHIPRVGWLRDVPIS